MKTAVEYLIENLQVILPQSQFNDVVVQNVIKEAKEIERQQTCIFGAKCCVKVLEKKDWSLEDLYNETFNTK